MFVLKKQNYHKSTPNVNINTIPTWHMKWHANLEDVNDNVILTPNGRSKINQFKIYNKIQ
jgi:hypothetical protein